MPAFVYTRTLVITYTVQEGNADCIANEDGERQIACAVSFHGEEMARIPAILQFTAT